MKIPSLLLFASALSVGIAYSRPEWSDFLLIALPCLIASVILWVKAWRARARRKWIIIDGSNVMHWQDGTPNIKTVRDVVDHLRAHGYTPGVVFDANAGYLLIGQYQHDRALSAQLDLPVDRVMVVPKGTPADPFILKAAKDYGGQIVSRDQFRDWAETHPEVTEPGHLVKGGYRKGQLWLDLPQPATA
jgi:hypothetical protein